MLLDVTCEYLYLWFYIFFFFYLIRLYLFFFFFSSRRRHTRYIGDWSSDVCSSDLVATTLFTREMSAIRKSSLNLAGFHQLLLFAETSTRTPGPIVCPKQKCWTLQIGRASCRERV